MVRLCTRPILQYTMKINDDDDDDDGDVETQGQSQVSGNNTTLTRALSAESLLSQTTISSPKFCHGQFHIHNNFSKLWRSELPFTYYITHKFPIFDLPYTPYVVL